jgi:hypothetical protein
MLFNLIIPSAGKFNNTVHNILQRVEYKHLNNGILDFINQVKEFILKLIAQLLIKIFSNLTSAPKISNNISTIFIIIGILVIVALIVVIAVKISKTFQKSSKVREILGEKITEGTTPKSLREKALNFKLQGDYRQAIRYDYIALLLLMHERNIIYIEETKTNDEIFSYLKKKEITFLNVFYELIKVFNSSWYGHKSYDDKGYEQWKLNLEKMWNEVVAYEIKD